MVGSQGILREVTFEGNSVSSFCVLSKLPLNSALCTKFNCSVLCARIKQHSISYAYLHFLKNTELFSFTIIVQILQKFKIRVLSLKIKL